MKELPSFLTQEFDPTNPNPWQALYLDRSTPLTDEVKQAWLTDSASTSRQYLLPFLRPIARLFIIIIQVFKVFLPRRWSASKLMHHLLASGLKHFVSPEANWLVLRHFHIGSQILDFVRSNAPVAVTTSPLQPPNIDALRDELFLKHDLNLFNFVIRLNTALRAQNLHLQTVAKPDFSVVQPVPLALADMPRGWFNVLDLQSAIELFTPVYQLFLTDDDFWRASNSLQLDETIGIYVATILGTPQHLILLNNKHPLVPMSTLRAGYRLVLHGLSSEMLHALLLDLKAQQRT